MNQTEKLDLIKKELCDAILSPDFPYSFPQDVTTNYDLIMRDEFFKGYLISLSFLGPKSIGPIFMLGLICGRILFKSEAETEMLYKLYNK